MRLVEVSAPSVSPTLSSATVPPLEDIHEKGKILILDVKTRWSSTHQMMGMSSYDFPVILDQQYCYISQNVQ